MRRRKFARTKLLNCDKCATTSAFQIYYNHPEYEFVKAGDLVTETGFSTRIEPMLMPSSDDSPDFDE